MEKILNFSKIAKKAGMSRSVVSRYINGERKLERYSAAKKLSAALSCDPRLLLEAGPKRIKAVAEAAALAAENEKEEKEVD